jgi:hypothetical protein
VRKHVRSKCEITPLLCTVFRIKPKNISYYLLIYCLVICQNITYFTEVFIIFFCIERINFYLEIFCETNKRLDWFWREQFQGK